MTVPHRKAEIAALHILKTYGGMEVYFHLFVTSALGGQKCSPSRPGHFNLRRPFE